MLAARGTPRSVLGTVPRAATPANPRIPRRLRPRRLPLFVCPQCRTKATKIGKETLRETTPLAEQLSATGVWNYGRWAKKDPATTAAKGAKAKTKKPKGDKHRVNIVSEALCDDVLGYMKSSLLPRHAGCDIVDIYPGAGLWSRKLHDVLQPRSHILLEPDADLYKPFLQPLLDRPNVSLIPKSGIIWRELSNVLSAEHLPHQVEKPVEDEPQRNDTLLVTANLAFFPKRRFSMFDSLTQLVLYQFINSIRASSLFNKYGLIRMLLWVESSDRHALLARSVQRRRRLAVDGELATEWITEVAGPDDFSPWFVRDTKLDVASTRQTLVRMERDGVEIPKGREPKNVRELRKPKRGPKPKKAKETSEVDDIDLPPVFTRPFREEQRALEARFDAGEFEPKSADHRRMLQLQYRGNREVKVAETVHALLQKRDLLADEYDVNQTRSLNIRRREQKWTADIDALSDTDRQEYILYRDNLHLFKQNPPVLAWDRRALEPLVARDDEFFPNAPCALLDIQPKAMHPLLRSTSTQAKASLFDSPDYGHSGDIFELILRGMLSMGAEPVRKAIESVWPGAAEGVLLHCPSLVDRRRGGQPVGGPYGELSARSLNETQWVEILDAWMRWPFRPTLPQLVARISEDVEVDDDDAMD